MTEGRDIHMLKKMKLAALVIALVGGCVTVQPFKAADVSSKSQSEAFDCALGIATSLDYTPEQVSRESGFFKAEHNYRPGASSIHWGASMTDELSVLVTNLNGQTKLQVTGSSGVNAGRNLRLTESSRAVIEAAQRIAADCR
jgi:hypothetical protein